MKKPTAQHIAEAKRLLRAQLEKHPDQGVRLLNEMAVLPDDDPAVMAVSRMVADIADRAAGLNPIVDGEGGA